MEESNTVRNNKQKEHISKAIKHTLQIRGLTLRTLSEKIDGISHPQIHRITKGQNYNIDTLIKVLDSLNLEIQIKEKTPKP